MVDKTEIEEIIKNQGFVNYKWIDPREVVVSHWVRFKCMFGCDSYAETASCPPNTPSIEECREFFKEYETALIFHFPLKLEDPEDRHEHFRKVNRQLYQLERAIFLAGYQKAFLLFVDECTLCEECTGVKGTCKNKTESRPTLEGLGVDVYKTVRNFGYPINVLPDYDQEMNRYGLILIE